MVHIDPHTDTGWFEVRDEDGNTAALRPIATVVSDGKVYSLMGAIRRSDTGESEGGLVLVRQNTLLHREGTRYEVVGDASEVEKVMTRVMQALVEEAETESSATKMAYTLTSSSSPREFSVCDDETLLQ